MTGRGVGHAPVADPTNTYCTVEDCQRLLSRMDPTQHMRGTGGRRRFGDDSPVTTRQGVKVVGGIVDLREVVARLERLQTTVEAAAKEKPDLPKVRVDMRILTEAFNETIEPVVQELDEIKAMVMRLAFEVRQSRGLPPLSPPVEQPTTRIERVG